MKVLAIETSTMLGGAAIIDDFSGLIAEVRLNVKSTHSERLLTEIDHIFQQTALNVSDIDVFAVAIGPGSFTGLRIGLSTVKGFSYATGKPIVSVPTLEALAWHLQYCRYPVCAMLDARKKEVYAALFKWENEGFTRLVTEISIKAEKIIEKMVILTDEKIIFTGEGSLLYRGKITELMGERAIFASLEKTIPSPSNVASIGIKKALRGEFSEPISLIPFYLRKSEAEIKCYG
ncbi:MAG: tRNA (adenosine(37)-N6)-threonylcarbamoyltransferase complex dimerization subunit type 1 TsaB [Nitrospirae bacterium]|jgi:tRNA threonylcarbamoyladenosine biosynthesis protein TsaB|nr:tRNA (adenosine(37)-N6)-threonylcarbamoyltransferase complex dimerization subunit type 1 TsaB [Nitrospirota bacterium]